jgi:hypothetical protein
MSEESLQLAQQRVSDRARARNDKMFLANDVLGYDFQQCHYELFWQYPKFDESKPWVEQNPIKNIMVLWARGHYKTTAIIVVIIQAIINNPDITILLMQGSVSITQTLLKQIKSHFLGEAEGSRFQELFPEFCGTKEALGPHPAMQFTVPCRKRKQIAQATVTVSSPRAIKTSQHYDLGVFDDLLHEANYRNPRLLAKLKDDFTAAQSLINPGCPRWVSGTRWAFGDLYEDILRWQTQGGKWTISIKPCWTDDGKDVRFPRHTKKNGQLGGFLREELEQMQSDDPAMFACQYLLQPIHSSQALITKEQLDAACIPAADVPHLSFPIMMVDLAATNNIKSDDSVIQVGQMDSLGTGYLTDQRGGQWVPMELALNVMDMALRHRPVRILFEKTSSGIYFADFLKLMAKQRNIILPIDFTKVDNQPDAKNIRVSAWAGMVKKGRFKFLLGIPKFDRLVEQAIEFPKGRYGHDDYPDTAALLYQEITKQFMVVPMSPRPTNPIIAMIQDQENALIKTLTEQELQLRDTPDVTGLE